MLIHDDFLLNNGAAVRLYHEYAEREPIIDYHNHLSPQEIAENRRFENLYEIWLAGDHYKWRLMRANGIDEHFCTGSAPAREKFLAFAKTVPLSIRNPIFHWTHLELKRFFGLDLFLNEATAEQVWNECNAQLQSRPELQTQGILSSFQVKALCTTDDPADELVHHQHLKSQQHQTTAVYPTFRPDWAMLVHQPEVLKPWLVRLEQTTNVSVSGLDDLLTALRQRHDAFHELGSRLSDHGFEVLPAKFCDESVADAIFKRALDGHAASFSEYEQFATFLMMFFARLDFEKGWTKQLHIGASRNNNRRLFERAGRDIGCDSIADTLQGSSLQRLLDRMDHEGCLPKTIVYNLNPRDNDLMATMIGNFQDGSIPGKMQYGAAWWFLDQKDGIEAQLNTLSNMGLLSRFIGMLTDSRSFMSVTRHEYFRRILCNLLGREMESGELPNDFEWIGQIVRDICYANAKNYLGLV